MNPGVFQVLDTVNRSVVEVISLLGVEGATAALAFAALVIGRIRCWTPAFCYYSSLILCFFLKSLHQPRPCLGCSLLVSPFYSLPCLPHPLLACLPTWYQSNFTSHYPGPGQSLFQFSWPGGLGSAALCLPCRASSRLGASTAASSESANVPCLAQPEQADGLLRLFNHGAASPAA